MREYKRKNQYNRVKEEHLEKIILHLKNIEKLKNGDTDNGKD